ncbi:terminase endonuclease subunit [Entomohabitans teleogrylli]|uniref:phage terminase small subunit n=1 Tax=Entomohabitans teleogrylli TaxID=1384589 RepID=UPI00073D4607|nr:terminase endonuclease subunit [Entomohabitans teleogrylli]
MMSPAQRHRMRVSAMMAAQREQTPLRHASAYEQMLVKMAADCRALKNIRSVERKADKKRELLPFWLPWVTGVLEKGTGAQDDILMTVMLWRLDVGDITGALEIARYALRCGLAMPGRHERPVPYLLAEEVALAALRARDAGQPVAVCQLLETLALTTADDMPDQVRARLHKVTGLVLRDNGQPADALAHLQRAMQLDRGAGVKKEIERLGRELNPAPAAKRKTPAKSRTSAAAPAKRGRGRPRKNAG